MSLTVYEHLEQGSKAWIEARAGKVTASTVGQLISTSAPNGISYQCPECEAPPEAPCCSLSSKEYRPLKNTHATRKAPDSAPPVIAASDGDTARTLTLHLLAEKITGHVEDTYTSEDMLRGQLDEPLARDTYEQHYAPVDEVGFMVRDLAYNYNGHLLLGYSPDGVVGDDGLLEIKSRRQKKHLATILADEVPAENMAQCQAGLLVSGRLWLDYVSWCGGMPMYVKRVYPDQHWFDAITDAVHKFELNCTQLTNTYNERTKGAPRTERTDHFADMEL